MKDDWTDMEKCGKDHLSPEPLGHRRARGATALGIVPPSRQRVWQKASRGSLWNEASALTSSNYENSWKIKVHVLHSNPLKWPRKYKRWRREVIFLMWFKETPGTQGRSELLLFLSKRASKSSKISSLLAAKQPAQGGGSLEENSNCEVKTPEMIELDLEARLEK